MLHRHNCCHFTFHTFIEISIFILYSSIFIMINTYYISSFEFQNPEKCVENPIKYNMCTYNVTSRLYSQKGGSYPTSTQLPLSKAIFKASISSANPDTLYMPSESIPLASISLTHFRTTNGSVLEWALSKVVRSMPNTPRSFFRSGMQWLGTRSEHFE